MRRGQLFYCLDVSPMLFNKYACRERRDRIFVADLDGALEDDRAGVECFVDEMHGTAGNLYSM